MNALLRIQFATKEAICVIIFRCDFISGRKSISRPSQHVDSSQGPPLCKATSRGHVSPRDSQVASPAGRHPTPSPTGRHTAHSPTGSHPAHHSPKGSHPAHHNPKGSHPAQHSPTGSYPVASRAGSHSAHSPAGSLVEDDTEAQVSKLAHVKSRSAERLSAIPKLKTRQCSAAERGVTEPSGQPRGDLYPPRDEEGWQVDCQTRVPSPQDYHDTWQTENTRSRPVSIQGSSNYGNIVAYRPLGR